MTYDPFGRRIQKTVSGTSVDFLYDPAGRPAVAMDAGGNYVRGEVFLGGMHLATYGANGNPYFAYADWMGTERLRRDAAGSTAQTCAWSDYGGAPVCTTNTDPAGISPHGYAGYEYDKESGLHHMWFRDYNPRLGRFLTTDPYDGSMDLSDPQSMNRYAYVGGNPVNWIDPLGLCGEPDQHSGWSDFSVTVTGFPPCLSALDGLGRGIIAPLLDVPPVANRAAGDYISCRLVDLLGNAFRTGLGVLDNGYNPPKTPPRRFFYTRWCGPGGGGSPTSPLDAACMAHDQCYDAKGLTFGDNLRTLSPTKGLAMRQCNQKLCDRVATLDTADSRSVHQFFSVVGGYRCR